MPAKRMQRLYARLAGSIIYANASLRADPSVLGKNRQGQSSLWAYAISGDLPIVLLRIADSDEYRSGAPTRAGPRVLAPARIGSGPRDPQRGSRRSPARPARTDHEADRRMRRRRPHRSAWRNLRAPCRQGLRRGRHSSTNRCPRRHQRRRRVVAQQLERRCATPASIPRQPHATVSPESEQPPSRLASYLSAT